MASVSKIQRTRKIRNKIPLNFVVRRKSKAGITVQKTIVPVSLSSGESLLSHHEDAHVPDSFTGSQEWFSSSEPSVPTQTDHTKRKTIMAEKWNCIRSNVTKVLIEGFGLLVGVYCNNCGESANIKCVQCGPLSFYCQMCAVEAHKSSLYHHLPKIWKVIIHTQNS